MNLEDLAKRITRLEDIEAVKQLKATYCSICDDDHNPDRIASIFSEDGVWEGRGIGHAQGHAAIRKLFEGFQKSISYSQQYAKCYPNGPANSALRQRVSFRRR